MSSDSPQEGGAFAVNAVCFPADADILYFPFSETLQIGIFPFSETLQIGIFPFFEITENEYFPFHGFVRHISGKSSYDMISGIKEFYDTLPEGKASVQSDGRYTEKEFFPLTAAGWWRQGRRRRFSRRYSNTTRKPGRLGGIDT